MTTIFEGPIPGSLNQPDQKPQSTPQRAWRFSRGPAYFVYEPGSFQNITYLDDDGDVVARVTYNTASLAKDQARYTAWCKREAEAARREARPSQCKYMELFN